MREQAIRFVKKPKQQWIQIAWQYGVTCIGILGITLILFRVRMVANLSNYSIIYLFAVLLCAVIAPPGVTLFCGLFSFLCYDFFLVPPVFTLQVDFPAQLIDPLAFLSVALVTCIMAGRSRQRAVQSMVYQEADAFRATLLHLISHNLRTPVATIKTALSSLLTLDEIPEDSAQLLRNADQECDRLNRLIGNVLQLSRVEASAVHIHNAWNAPDEVVSTSVRRWQPALENHSLKVTLPPALPLVQFDFDLIEAVLINLIENAFRHGCPPVLVEVALVENEIRFSVQDTGRGVPPTQRSELFTRFSSSTSDGIGLGLAVCKGLIALHGGRIWAEFEPRATRFVFSLPLICYQDETDDSPLDC